MPRRRSGGEKSKFHQTLGFNPDPLNLAALCNRKDGTDSPEVKSPIIDRSNRFEPDIVQILDRKDPLNLNHVEDGGCIKPVGGRRKRRKRRNTGGALTDTEELSSISSILNCSYTDSPFGLSDSSIFIDKHDNSKHESSKTNDNIDIKLDSDDKKDIEKPKITIECDNTNNKLNTTTTITTTPQTPQKCHKRMRNSFQKNMKFNDKNKRYRYGNYVDCNDISRMRNNMIDHRLNFFSKDWFEGKCCLDVGCNTGKVTILIGKHFSPTKIVGVDIDSNLIKIAKRRVQEYYMVERNMTKFPKSFQLTYGPVLSSNILDKKMSCYFPDNVSFLVENFVPETPESLKIIEAEYDVILCLNVTKWVHLNFGDKGLKLFFKKLFTLLKPGGRLLFQPQSYNSYKKKKNMVMETWKNFTELKLMPTDFISCLLSSEIGFARSECLTYSIKGKIGYERPLYLLTKSYSK